MKRINFLFFFHGSLPTKEFIVFNIHTLCSYICIYADEYARPLLIVIQLETLYVKKQQQKRGKVATNTRFCRY